MNIGLEVVGWKQLKVTLKQCIEPQQSDQEWSVQKKLCSSLTWSFICAYSDFPDFYYFFLSLSQSVLLMPPGIFPRNFLQFFFKYYLFLLYHRPYIFVWDAIRKFMTLKAKYESSGEDRAVRNTVNSFGSPHPLCH